MKDYLHNKKGFRAPSIGIRGSYSIKDKIPEKVDQTYLFFREEEMLKETKDLPELEMS